LFMEITGFGEYVTRDGQIVTIDDYCEEATYQWFGVVEERALSWASDGNYLHKDKDHKLDLIKPRNQKEDNMYNNFKQWLDKNSEMIFTLIAAYLIDRIVFGGEFSDRLKSIFDKGLKKQETKLLGDK